MKCAQIAASVHTTKRMKNVLQKRDALVMKGQLRFDEFMNISEEMPKKEEFVRRTPMADPCYYCLCTSCMNNAESRTVSPEEVPYDWNPCFLCDECSVFDGKSPKNMEQVQCSRYVIDNYHAEKNRKRFKIVR